MELAIRPEGARLLLVGAIRSEPDFRWFQRYPILLKSWGQAAHWWDFLLHAEHIAALKAWPYLYGYFQEEILFKMHVVGYRSRAGTDGLPSPWPKVTEEVYRNRSGAFFDGRQWTFKTWFLIDGFEKLEYPVPRNDLVSADGRPAQAFRKGFMLWRLKSPNKKLPGR